MSEAARAYRVLPTSRQRYDDGQAVRVRLDEAGIAVWAPLGPDAVRGEIARQLVEAYGRRATTPAEYRLLIRWLRYEVADQMAARYPASGPQSVAHPATLAA
ncbi:hypothetical protein KBX37_10120 [Micromonospora sp. U56]|uniref:hypothetical protein n=1 Tax=Micromonospora sp. U56 TaxID=2824900 RepID=UPI001B38F187|nr:hypothetical protein [Micromonospora sp. U56]MBQ0893446.1 hypothetical protein [Micromonospora sp. U56]